MNMYDGEDNKRTFETLFSQMLTVPGVLIRRDEFLHKELRKYCPQSLIKKAVKYTPLQAGVSKEVIQGITERVIRYESSKAAVLALATGIPNFGLLIADLGTIAVDIVAYSALVLRVVQQLAYLYGYEEFDFDRENTDAETMNRILTFSLIMAGCQGISSVLKEFMETLSEASLKVLPEKPLTKGIIYPAVKQIFRFFGIRLNKTLFAQGVSMLIPFAGGLISGVLTYLMFRWQCRRILKMFQMYAMKSFEEQNGQ